jgi:hypothetical protein
VVKGPQDLLNSLPVEWSFEIASGQSCVRGLRSGAMTLDTLKISSPANPAKRRFKVTA